MFFKHVNFLRYRNTGWHAFSFPRSVYFFLCLWKGCLVTMWCKRPVIEFSICVCFFFVFVYFLFNLPPIGARKWSTLLLLLMGSSWSTCIRKLSRDSSNTDFISIGFCLKRYTDRLWGDLQGTYSPRVSLEL